MGDEHFRKRRRTPEQPEEKSPGRLSLGLCDTCRQINWHPILLDCCSDDQVTHSFPYPWANIPTLRQMEARQHYCSFCKLCSTARQARVPLQEPALADKALQLVWYVRNIQYGYHHATSSKDWNDPRRSNIERMDAMGFRLFVIRAAFGPGTIHINMHVDSAFPPLRRILRSLNDGCATVQHLICDTAYDVMYNKMQWPQLFAHLDLRFHFRVIDVLEKRVVDAPVGCSYIALSYVWGECPGVVRASKSHKRRTPEGKTYVEILDAGVPRTIYDAMRVTEILEERYLWVDALCIVQDDEGELAATLGAMHAIYAAARLTIVAAPGTDAGAGLAGALPLSGLTIQRTEIVHGVAIMLEAQSLSGRLATSCWRTRAWTYQEEYFSTRLLVFFEDYVYFRCRVDEHCEDIDIEDDDVQSYFLNSGRMTAVWLQAKKRDNNIIICSNNTTSVHTEHREQLQSGLGEECLSEHYVSELAETDNMTSCASISSDWKSIYLDWLEETRYSGLRPTVANEQAYTKGHVVSWSRTVGGRRRHSDAGSAGSEHSRQEEGEPSINRVWWIDRRRSTGGPLEASKHTDSDNSFRLTVPDGSEEPFDRKSKTLACRQSWLTSKFVSEKMKARKQYQKWWAEISPFSKKDKRRQELEQEGSPSRGEVMKQYVTVIVEFTKRSLARQCDMLNAVQGIMSHFERLTGAGIMFGLPLAFFDDALIWKHADDKMLGDWFDPWRRHGESWADSRPGRTHRVFYVYDLGGRKEWKEKVKARIGRGCVRKCDMYAGCDGLPTWSWCGWQEAVDYYGDMLGQSEMKGKIVWPWSPQYTHPLDNLIPTPREGIMQVEAWIAAIDLGILQSLKCPDVFLGWPVENGQRVRDGVVECILLSTDVNRQYGIHQGALIYNIMIVGRDVVGGTVYRRGISQLFPEDWKAFKPRQEWIALR